MFAADATSVAVPYDAVPCGVTIATPSLGSASDVVESAVRVITEVFADAMLDFPIGARASPLLAVRRGSDALHRFVLEGHRAQPTTITTPTLWEHLVRFN